MNKPVAQPPIAWGIRRADGHLDLVHTPLTDNTYMDEGDVAFPLFEHNNGFYSALLEAAEKLSDESEEFEFDDGLGRGAQQIYWDELFEVLGIIAQANGDEGSDGPSAGECNELLGKPGHYKP